MDKSQTSSSRTILQKFPTRYLNKLKIRTQKKKKNHRITVKLVKQDSIPHVLPSIGRIWEELATNLGVVALNNNISQKEKTKLKYLF